MMGTKKDIRELTTRFDPMEWEALSLQNSASGRGIIFQNGVNLVHDAYRRLSRPGQNWLDAGCGTGRLAQLLAEEGANIFGLDADEAMLRFAKEKSERRTSKGGPVSFIGASVDGLPFCREKLDGVAAVSLLGCLAEPQYFFLEIYQILRPGGYALLTFTNRHSVMLRVNNMVHSLASLYRGNKTGLEQYHLYSLKEALQSFADAGLKVLEIIFYNFFFFFSNRIIPRYPLIRRVNPPSSNGFGNALARNFLVIGKKL